jgi:hypothetical protein
MNPTTSPASASAPGGPCRAGTPVTVTVPPSGRWSLVDSQNSSPGRCRRGTSTTGGGQDQGHGGQERSPRVVEVVVVLVVGEQDRVDPADVVR